MNELDHVSGDELTPSHDVLSAKLAEPDSGQFGRDTALRPTPA